METKPQRQLSIRMDAKTRVDLDYLVEISGLKAAQVIRQAIKRVADQARTEVAASTKAARRAR